MSNHVEWNQQSSIITKYITIYCCKFKMLFIYIKLLYHTYKFVIIELQFQTT